MSAAVDKAGEKTMKLVVVRVRGPVRVDKVVNYTLDMLHMERVNSCTLLEGTPVVYGMLRKVKDYVTYGEIDEATHKALIEKRSEPFKGRLTDSKGEIKYNKFITVDGKKLKPFFRLSPPRGGYERKGIKWSFKQGGALGYRGKEINKLVMRMI
jgi:large subunit ribosomal protein L30